MRFLVAGIAWAAAVLAFASPVHAQGAAATRAPRTSARSAHPDVGAERDCRGCHASATPRSFEAWKQSKHGLDLVTCVVCHGSTGSDFKRRPATDRCTGCHAAFAASLGAPFMKRKDCFLCHPGHSLDPHATVRETTAARVSADVELQRELKAAGPVNGPGAVMPAAPAAAPAQVPVQAPAQAPAQVPAQAPATAPPGEEKDLGTAQPHPPTDRH